MCFEYSNWWEYRYDKQLVASFFTLISRKRIRELPVVQSSKNNVLNVLRFLGVTDFAADLILRHMPPTNRLLFETIWATMKKA